jgi:Tol biopolymer transport system component
MHIRRILLLLILLSASCQALSAPTPTATPSPTLTVTPSVTPTATHTPLPTNPPATATPTETATTTLTSTITSTPTTAPTASITPQPTVGFVFDNWNLVELPSDIDSRLNTPLIAFVNQNDRDNISNGGTPQPATNIETLYYVPANNSAGRFPILQLPASTESRIFISANGRSIAYLRDESGGPGTGGLYILDMQSRISGRILPITSLVERGFPSQPTWTADGSRLAIALATGYDMDIFALDKNGSNIQNLTNSGSYDLWPSWSPDGRYLLFVSDRVRCPSWIPGDENACDALTTPPPNGGNPYLLEVATGAVSQLSDQWVTEPPRWLDNNKIVFSSGDPAFGDPERTLWIGDANTKVAREVRLADGTDGPIRLSEAWAADGSAVIYQNAGESTTEIIAVNVDGSLIGRTSELNFPRYGMAAAWSVDGTRIAIGGLNGQCQYGVRVFDRNLDSVASGSPPPSMCNPSYSSDGQWLVFTGINPQVDGRIDVYVATLNGFGSANLTGGLRGAISLIGWVGGV